MDTVLIASVASAYGILSASAFLFQLLRMRRTESARDLSLSFMGIVTGGYLIWLVYGLSISSLPLIFAEALGLGMSAWTLIYALRLRHVWSGYDEMLTAQLTDTSKITLVSHNG